MDEYLRIVIENGVTKIYYYSSEKQEPFLIHELNDGEAVRVMVNDGKLSSINEKRL